MSNVIDLSDESTCPEQLLFHATSLKVTGGGVEFFSYNGLRMYLITGKKVVDYLRVNGNQVIENESSNIRYEYIPDLYEIMEETLRINVAKFPLLRLKFNKKTEIVWRKPKITQAEEEWVKIVRRVAQQF